MLAHGRRYGLVGRNGTGVPPPPASGFGSSTPVPASACPALGWDQPAITSADGPVHALPARSAEMKNIFAVNVATPELRCLWCGAVVVESALQACRHRRNGVSRHGVLQARQRFCGRWQQGRSRACRSMRRCCTWSRRSSATTRPCCRCVPPARLLRHTPHLRTASMERGCQAAAQRCGLLHACQPGLAAHALQPASPGTNSAASHAGYWGHSMCAMAAMTVHMWPWLAALWGGGRRSRLTVLSA